MSVEDNPKPDPSLPDPQAGMAKDREKGSAGDTDPSDQPGDESRARLQDEVRREVAAALGSFQRGSAGVVIIGDKLTFEGSITGGNSTQALDRTSTYYTEISRRTVEEIARVHVAPAGFDDLVELRESVVLLRAHRRWGSTTTAIKLMSQLKSIYDLSYGGPLSALPVDELPAGCGFIIKGLSQVQVAELRARDLPALEDRFTLRHSRLIVIIEPGARLADHAVDRSAHALHGPPQAEAFLVSHLTEVLSSLDTAQTLLQDEGLRAALDSLDSEAFDARQLAELAHDLAEIARGQGTMEQAIERFNDRSRRDVESWLDSLTDFDQRATVVALAVLDGMPYDAVSRAATLLEDAWREGAGGQSYAPRARRPRSVRLQNARARITHEVRRTRYGPAEMEVISFIDSTYPARILQHLWYEHDYDRDILIDWLRAVAEDVDHTIRIRAALAIGFLASFDFDTIRRDVIAPWARSGNGDERERAVAALALPARHPDTAARTRRMTFDWAENGGSDSRLSAARALGTAVGALVPGGPDEQLAELAKDASYRLAIAIGVSIAELLADAPLARQLELLRMLESWSAEGRTGRQRAGVIGFLELANNLWSSVSTPDGETVWPTVLLLATAADPVESRPDFADEDTAVTAALRAAIAGLWGRSLVAPGTDVAVRRVLRNWAARAEQAPELRSPMIRLLISAATTDRQLRLLAFHAKGWRDKKPLAPDLAQKLLDVLERKDGLP